VGTFSKTVMRSKSSPEDGVTTTRPSSYCLFRRSAGGATRACQNQDVRVAAYQAPYRPYPADGGAELVVPFLQRAQEQHVDLVCCPESLVGELANESDGDTPATVALSVEDGQLTDALAPLFGWPMAIVVGFTRRVQDGTLYNAAAVIIDGSVAGIYHKLYPGRSVCVPGEDLPIFEHAGVRFGVLICADAHYIEPARLLASRGAELLVVPVHGGHRPDKENAWRARGTNVHVARSVENGLPLVAADIAGWQGERVSRGTSATIDNQGTILAAARPLEEDFIVADVTDDGPRSLDGALFGGANPYVAAEFRALLD
jgi:5-aminopentanamidase